MRADVVITLTGPDRVGIVEEVTGLLAELGCNVERSMAARLGGEFAVLMLASCNRSEISAVRETLDALSRHGYRLTYTPTNPDATTIPPDARIFRVVVSGADHEGIIHQIAHGLAMRGISVAAMETWTEPAPTSGSPLFKMSAEVAVPADLKDTDWIVDLEEAAHIANVDVAIEPR